MKMTITRGLAELKLLDARIKKQIGAAVFTDYKNTKQTSTQLFNVAPDAFENRAKADFQSVQDLIKQRQKIKSAIMASNATTRVKIAGSEYTVSEAIDRKSAIEYAKLLLARMKQQRATVTQQESEINAKIEANIQRLLEQNLSAQGKTANKDDYEFIAKPFREANEVKILDPLNLADKITELDKDIEDFEKEVDFTLSESNSRTEIDV